MSERDDFCQRTQRPDSRAFHTEEWKPTFTLSIVWTVLGTLMTIGGLLLFAWIYTLINGELVASGAGVDFQSDDEPSAVTLRIDVTFLVIIATIAVLLIHEAVHALGFRLFGGRPVFGAMVVQKILPVLYCSAPGYRFTRGQFSIIIMGPLVVISVAGTALMPFVDNWLLLVAPLGVNFGGAVGDIWMFCALLRRQSDTQIEDLKDGLRFYFPADGGAVKALPEHDRQG